MGVLIAAGLVCNGDKSRALLAAGANMRLAPGPAQKLHSMRQPARWAFGRVLYSSAFERMTFLANVQHGPSCWLAIKVLSTVRILVWVLPVN